MRKIPAVTITLQADGRHRPSSLKRRAMDVTDLRIALFSGNYNYTRDGANQALNRLAGFLLRQGAALRVYAPVSYTHLTLPTKRIV